MRLPLAAAIAAAALSLGACAYNPGMSVGYGNYGGYGGYGGYGAGYDPYYDGYSPYGYNTVGYSRYGGYGGYGSPFGWYNGYYYPGTGYYVYDQYRRPRVWSDRERQYWVRIKPQSQGTTTTTANTVRAAPTANWSGFNRPRQVRATTPTARAERRAQVRTTNQSRRDERRRDREE